MNKYRIKALRKLLKAIPNNLSDKDGGLCGNYYDVNNITDESQGFLLVFHLIIAKWEHFSGSVLFPIPVTDTKFSGISKQYFHGEKWEGKQLELRIDLVKFIISELEKEL